MKKILSEICCVFLDSNAMFEEITISVNGTKTQRHNDHITLLFRCVPALLTRWGSSDQKKNIFHKQPETQITKTSTTQGYIYSTKVFLGNDTKEHTKRDNEPMIFKVLQGGEYDTKVKMGALARKQEIRIPKIKLQK